jgi:hypothetical protein
MLIRKSRGSSRDRPNEDTTAGRERLQIITSDAILLRQQGSIGACTAMVGDFQAGRDETNSAPLA